MCSLGLVSYFWGIIMKCKLCLAHLTPDDLQVDDDLCLSCLNDTDGEDESYGILKRTRIPGGEMQVIHSTTGYILDLITFHYDTETVSHLRTKYTHPTLALNAYMDKLRTYM